MSKLQRVHILDMEIGKMYIFTSSINGVIDLHTVKMQENGNGLVNIATNELWRFENCYGHGPVNTNEHTYIATRTVDRAISVWRFKSPPTVCIAPNQKVSQALSKGRFNSPPIPTMKRVVQALSNLTLPLKKMKDLFNSIHLDKG